MNPGIYRDMTHEEYTAIDAVNFSALKPLAISPAEAKWESEREWEPTAAMVMGIAAHCAALEPDKFEERFVRCAAQFKVKKADREVWNKTAEDNPDATLLRPTEYDAALNWAQLYRDHPVAGELMRSEGPAEVTVVFKDPETNLLCKIRPDKLTTWRGWTVVLDMKATNSVDTFKWERNAAQFQYHTRAAFYLHGLDCISERERRYVFPCVQTTGRPRVRVFEPDDAAINSGRVDMKAYLRVYAACLKSGEWYDDEEEVTTFTVPRWNQRTEEEITQTEEIR